MADYDSMSLPELLSITWTQAAAVVIAVVAVYFFLLFLMRVFTQRVSTRLATYDVPMIIIIGSIAGRATLGHIPVLAAGIIALLTLFCLRALMAFVRRFPAGERFLTNRPVVVMTGTDVLRDELRHVHVSEHELWTALRRAGVRNDDEVAAVILEGTGEFSVLKRGELIDPKLLVNVRGAQNIPASFIGE